MSMSTRRVLPFSPHTILTSYLCITCTVVPVSCSCLRDRTLFKEEGMLKLVHNINQGKYFKTFDRHLLSPPPPESPSKILFYRKIVGPEPPLPPPHQTKAGILATAFAHRRILFQNKHPQNSLRCLCLIAKA